MKATAAGNHYFRRWVVLASLTAHSFAINLSSQAQDSIATILNSGSEFACYELVQDNDSSALSPIASPELRDVKLGNGVSYTPAPDEPVAARFRTKAFDEEPLSPLQNNFTAFPEFSGGLIVLGERSALKIGGFVKADFISDLDPIESEDSFDTTRIPIGVADYQNARFHAKQSRLSFDTRWLVDDEVARAFVEADYFGGDDGENGSLRLRHAYGTLGRFTAGQTWTTFTDPSAVPQTLDVEGAVSNVNRRQGLVRLNFPLGDNGWFWAVALEDPSLRNRA